MSMRTGQSTKCEEAAEFVSALHDLEGIPPTLAEHVRGCETCQARMKAYGEIGMELRRVASMELPGEVRARTWERWLPIPSLAYRVSKRFLDITGSLMALTLLSPLFLVISVAIKSTSEGPVFFRQRRVGYRGQPFVFLKFRSMKVGNDATLHKEYVERLLSGQGERYPASGNGPGVFKLTSDPRITKVGAFLRKTSLDELPQFINVLKGDMSLVGPRPPIPYEVEAYEDWHKLRLSCKPGITGLWQVSCRGRVTFDEMVSLDLSYIRQASIFLDLKTLLRTARAVVLGPSTSPEIRFIEKNLGEAVVNVRRSLPSVCNDPFWRAAESVQKRDFVSQEAFHRMISLERRRTERSRKPLLLMLLDIGAHLPTETNEKNLSLLLAALSVTTRETDVVGWYETSRVVGLMSTEICLEDRKTIVSTMISKLSEILRNHLTLEQFNQVSISFHVFPEDWDTESRKPSFGRDDADEAGFAVKRPQSPNLRSGSAAASLDK